MGVAQSIQREQNSHVIKLSGCDEILQSDWSWWNWLNSNNRTNLWIGLIPDLLPGNSRGRRRPTNSIHACMKFSKHNYNYDENFMEAQLDSIRPSIVDLATGLGTRLLKIKFILYYNTSCLTHSPQVDMQLYPRV